MAQHRDPRFSPSFCRDVIGEILTHPTQATLAQGMGLGNLFAAFGTDRLSHDHNGKVAPLRFQGLNRITNGVNGIVNLRDDNHVGSPRDPGTNGDMSGIATHDL